MQPKDDIQMLVDRYLNGELSPSQTEEFENLMKNDKTLRKAVNNRLLATDFLLEDVDEDEIDFDSVQKNERAQEYFKYYTNPENKQFYKSLKDLSVDNQTPEINQPKRIWFNPRVAAAIVLLFVSIVVFRYVNSTELYEEYSQYNDLPSLTMKSESDQLIQQAEQAFHSEDYKEAANLFGQYNSEQGELSDIGKLYYAISLAETNHAREAIEILEPIRNNSESLIQADAYWYSALFALKSENYEESRAFLATYQEFPNAKYLEKAKDLSKEIANK